jgi:phosphomannomutase
MIQKYPCSGEINTQLDNPAAKIDEIKKVYKNGKQSYLDGVSVEFDNWRFNVRMSNTEPLIRLNVETRGDTILMKEKTEELLELIRS